ncbi:transposase [Salinadaptatus halalkaliphilus]|uniref:Transposase n=1 Tax=Salinadaptatus halalkaliphilus TaxID=2419781 RepID=A0A4V6RUC2_9EURY|nr:RNA-guided endonuclease TnpB family protein [Salinadaptatus halalkaliphilus]THE63857.1 transposase [Salinadaptatus halalkaliphilus]
MATDYLRRTAITRLSLGDDQQTLLDRTIAEWKQACNTASRIGRATGETQTAALQQLAYDDIREQTSLGSQHTILAVRQAAAALDGIEALDSTDAEYTTSRPSFTSDTITYDPRSMTLFDDDTVSLATVDERIRCELVLPDDDGGHQYRYLDAASWEVTESTLSKRDGEYYLHIGFRKPTPASETETEADTADRTVLGVDLGIVNIATTSTAYFASGRELRHRHREFERVRNSLYQRGTQSAYRTIRRMSGRESRYVRDVMHQVANDILEEATVHGCTHIVFEDLKHIRENAPPGKQFHQWAHRQLVELVEYKARAIGIDVEFVSPANTSRRCPDCGYTSDRNRTSQSQFECKRCGTTANADYVGAKNVGMRFVRHGRQSSGRTGDGQLALKSGTVTPNGTVRPYATG